MLETGQMAPDFTLPDQDGQPFTLSSLRGGYVVLYFYPKDNTSGCTKEACSLNGELDAFSGLGARVVGVSADGVIRSTFLIDPEGRIARIWRKVNTATHGQDVRAALEALES